MRLDSSMASGEPGGGYATVSRLAPCEKMCQEFNGSSTCPGYTKRSLLIRLDVSDGDFGCAVTCFLSRMKKPCR